MDGFITAFADWGWLWFILGTFAGLILRDLILMVIEES